MLFGAVVDARPEAKVDFRQGKVQLAIWRQVLEFDWFAPTQMAFGALVRGRTQQGTRIPIRGQKGETTLLPSLIVSPVQFPAGRPIAVERAEAGRAGLFQPSLGVFEVGQALARPAPPAPQPTGLRESMRCFFGSGSVWSYPP